MKSYILPRYAKFPFIFCVYRLRQSELKEKTQMESKNAGSKKPEIDNKYTLMSKLILFLEDLLSNLEIGV